MATYSSSNPYASDIFSTAMQQIGQNAGGGGGVAGNPELKQIYDLSMGQAQAGANGMGGLGQNPYLSQLGDQITGQMTDNFNRNVMPGMDSGLMAAGGYGGSRHGVMQANATNDLNKQIGGSLANLYNAGYQSDQQYDLGLRNNALGWGNMAQGATNSALQNDMAMRNNALGWGGVAQGLKSSEMSANAQMAAAQTAANASMHNAGLANELGYANLDRNINNDNLGWQMQGAQFGLGLQDRMQANNQGMYNVGNTIQNQPLNYWQQFADQSNAFGQGYATTQQTSPNNSNPMMGVMGGMQLANSFRGSGNLWGGSWMGGGSNPNVAGDAYMPAYQPMGSF